MNSAPVILTGVNQAYDFLAFAKIPTGKGFVRTHWMDCPESMRVLEDSLYLIDGIVEISFFQYTCIFKKRDESKWEDILPKAEELINTYLLS